MKQLREIIESETIRQMAGMNELLRALDNEVGALRTWQATREVEQVCGVSPISEKYWALPTQLEAREKAVLLYFLPLKKWIAKSTERMAACLTEALEVGVQVVHVTNQRRYSGTHTIHDELRFWRVGINSVVHGDATLDRVCFHITLGPVSTTQLRCFLPGTRKWCLLEEVLCPNFLPHDADYKIRVVTAENNRQFTLSDRKYESRIGISTTVS